MYNWKGKKFYKNVDEMYYYMSLWHLFSPAGNQFLRSAPLEIFLLWIDVLIVLQCV